MIFIWVIGVEGSGHHMVFNALFHKFKTRKNFLFESNGKGPLTDLHNSFSKLFEAESNSEEKLSAKNNILKYSKINLICGDGENIPLNDNSVDVVTLSFGIRNMTDRLKCLEECYRVLKPEGLFLCMEFSMPENYTLRNIYDAWSFFVIPKLGKLIAKSEDSYKYLVESIRTFPKPEEFVDILEKANFKRTSIKQLSGNIVCIYKSRKI